MAKYRNKTGNLLSILIDGERKLIKAHEVFEYDGSLRSPYIEKVETKKTKKN